MPDLEITPTVEDLLKGRDGVMQFTLDLIRTSAMQQ
jgi:hypothetical protein